LEVLFIVVIVAASPVFFSHAASTSADAAAAKIHVITLGKAVPTKWFPGSGET
jgi:hypothetical protein